MLAETLVSFSSGLDSCSPGGSQIIPRLGPDKCEICLRSAQGHHYGVPACKGCKTFFRRMCVSSRETKCKMKNDCFDPSKHTHLHHRCQACRFKKCLDVGMNPLSLELKESEIESPIIKKFMRATKPTIIAVRSNENTAPNLINMLIHLESRIETFRISTFNPTYAEYGSLKNLVDCGSRFARADKFGDSRIRDVQNNLMPYYSDKKLWPLFNVLTTIEYAKTFDFFNLLEMDDKLALLKHVTLICLNLHMAYFAVSKKVDGCLQPDGSEQPQKDEMHYPLVSMSFGPLIRCNIQPIEYYLLKAICLCNPVSHGLSLTAQMIISSQRHQFTNILLDHCQRHNKNGPSRFVELLGIIPLLEKQQRSQKDIHIAFISRFLERFNGVMQFLDDILCG